MRLSNVSLRNGLLALTFAGAALFATAASADPGHGRGHWKDNDRRGNYDNRGGDYRGQVRYRDGGQVRYRDGGGARVRIDAHYRSGGGGSYRSGGGYYRGGGGSYGGGGYGGRVYVRSAPRVVYAQPQRVYVRCAPRYVSYRPHRVIIVRPAPYARVGINFGRIGISAILGHGWNDCDYGCNFCDAHFSSYGSYSAHVQSCAYRPRDCDIQCRPWDNAGYQEWRGNDDGQCEDRYGYDNDDRGDYRSNDGYDDDDRYYDEDDDN